MPEKNILLNSAAKAGLVLGAVSILSMLLTWLLGKIGGDGTGALIAVSVADTLVWAAKYEPEAGNSRVFRFGMLTALLSALVYSAFYMAYLMFIEPESIDMALDVIRQNPMMDSNSIAAAEQIAPMLPTYAFFMNLVYCFVYGTILSAILSRNIPPRNPFAGENFNRQ